MTGVVDASNDRSLDRSLQSRASEAGAHTAGSNTSEDATTSSYRPAYNNAEVPDQSQDQYATQDLETVYSFNQEIRKWKKYFDQIFNQNKSSFRSVIELRLESLDQARFLLHHGVTPAFADGFWRVSTFDEDGIPNILAPYSNAVLKMSSADFTLTYLDEKVTEIEKVIFNLDQNVLIQSERDRLKRLIKRLQSFHQDLLELYHWSSPWAEIHPHARVQTHGVGQDFQDTIESDRAKAQAMLERYL